MAIRPIDLQVNVSQMHDVAKTEQARSAAASELQSSLAGEAVVKARLVPTRVEENKKTEQTAIEREKKEELKRKNRQKKEANASSSVLKNEVSDDIDERLGHYIDVRK